MNQMHFILSSKIPWFGNYSGYEQLPLYLKKIYPQTRIIRKPYGLVPRLVGKLFSIYRGRAPGDTNQAAAELWLTLNRAIYPNAISHLLWLENHLQYLDCWQSAPTNLIGTIHLPPNQWNAKMLSNLKTLNSALILYQRDLDFFEGYVGKNRIRFIHYGVDVDFFHPDSQKTLEPKRILISGHYLRNTDMLYRVISVLTRNHTDLVFDLLVPKQARNVSGFDQLNNCKSVVWHEYLAGEESKVLELYQRSYLLLLPMNDNGASTAVVEGLATGLPIITTDVGGIRDYGGGDIYPVVANNDDEAMIDLIEQYLMQPEWRNEIAKECRQFSVDNLAWPIIAQKHLEAYQALSL